MGKRGTIISCIASLGLFALGATLGAHRTRRRNRRRLTTASHTPPTSVTPSNTQHGGLETTTSHQADTSTAMMLTTTMTTAAAAATSTTSTITNATPLTGASSAAFPNAATTTSIPTPTPSSRKPGVSDMGNTASNTTTTTIAATANNEANTEDGETFGLPSLDCPVCLTELVLPRITQCGHTLCTSCLTQLATHERHPSCPVCRRKIRVPLEKLAINFLAQAHVEYRVSQRGEAALLAYRNREQQARIAVAGGGGSTGAGHHGGSSGGMLRLGGGGSGNGNNGNGHGSSGMDGDDDTGRVPLTVRLRPAWVWFKWSVIIVTEFGAFLVSLKEVLEAGPSRSRRYQRIV